MRENEGERERMKARYRKRIRESIQDKNWEIQERREVYFIRRMGFDALNSLDQTIERLLSSYVISIDPHSRGLLMCADDWVKKLIEILKSLKYSQIIESEAIKAVEKIGEAARELEDVLDSHVSGQFLQQSESGEDFQLVGDEQIPFLYSLSLQGIEKDIDGFIKMEKLLNPWFKGEEEEFDQSGASVTRTWLMSWFAKKAASIFLGMKEDYIQDLENLFPKKAYADDDYDFLFTSPFSGSYRNNRCRDFKVELIGWWIKKVASSLVVEKDEEDEKEKNDDDVVVSSRTESAVNIVGISDLVCKIRNDLIKEGGSGVRSIVGMAGIGKTVLATKILEDPLISSKFEFRIFVSLGLKYKHEEITHAILAQIPDEDKPPMVGNMDIHEYLKETLKIKKCLIVLDDVWDLDFSFSFLWNIYPFQATECWVLVTTRLNQVAKQVVQLVGPRVAGRDEVCTYSVPFLNKEDSWDLLRGKIFGEKGCPREFEKAGKKIAENCEGLPLLIVTVADLLSKAEKTLEYWSKISTDKTNSIFVGAYDQICEVVYPSYANLSRLLKLCFLYLGIFPQNDEIRVSKLICLWSADGFLGVGYTDLQAKVASLLKDIVSNNVALESQRSCIFDNLKACSLHSVFWYLCKREAWKEKFLLVLNSYTDASVEGRESRRRLSIYKNAILIIKDVHDSIASMSVVRSLLCTGPYHQYQVPIFFGLRLLKVLDALTIRFYEFPMEVFKLLQLRYLALTCNENLPPSISKLWSLQTLIVHQHMSIKSSYVSQSYLPVEIWDLHELEYLQITGKNIPDPPPDAVLSKLLILLDVGALTCTKCILGSIPNLEKLRVQIELSPVASKPIRLFDAVSHIERLKSLQFVVMNPALLSEIVAPPPLFSASIVRQFKRVKSLQFAVMNPALLSENFASPPSFSTSFLRKLTLSGLGYPWIDMKKIVGLPYLQVLKLRCYAFRGKKWEVKETDFPSLRYLLVEDTDLEQWTGILRVQYLTIKNCYKLEDIPRMQSSTAKEIRVVDCNPFAVMCARTMATSTLRVYVDSSWLADGKHS